MGITIDTSVSLGNTQSSGVRIWHPSDEAKTKLNAITNEEEKQTLINMLNGLKTGQSISEDFLIELGKKGLCVAKGNNQYYLLTKDQVTSNGKTKGDTITLTVGGASKECEVLKPLTGIPNEPKQLTELRTMLSTGSRYWEQHVVSMINWVDSDNDDRVDYDEVFIDQNGDGKKNGDDMGLEGKITKGFFNMIDGSFLNNGLDMDELKAAQEMLSRGESMYGFSKDSYFKATKFKYYNATSAGKELREEITGTGANINADSVRSYSGLDSAEFEKEVTYYKTAYKDIHDVDLGNIEDWDNYTLGTFFGFLHNKHLKDDAYLASQLARLVKNYWSDDISKPVILLNREDEILKALEDNAAQFDAAQFDLASLTNPQKQKLALEVQTRAEAWLKEGKSDEAEKALALLNNLEMSGVIDTNAVSSLNYAVEQLKAVKADQNHVVDDAGIGTEHKAALDAGSAAVNNLATRAKALDGVAAIINENVPPDGNITVDLSPQGFALQANEKLVLVDSAGNDICEWTSGDDLASGKTVSYSGIVENPHLEVRDSSNQLIIKGEPVFGNTRTATSAMTEQQVVDIYNTIFDQTHKDANGNNILDPGETDYTKADKGDVERLEQNITILSEENKKYAYLLLISCYQAKDISDKVLELSKKVLTMNIDDNEMPSVALNLIQGLNKALEDKNQILANRYLELLSDQKFKNCRLSDGSKDIKVPDLLSDYRKEIDNLNQLSSPGSPVIVENLEQLKEYATAVNKSNPAAVDVRIFQVAFARYCKTNESTLTEQIKTAYQAFLATNPDAGQDAYQGDGMVGSGTKAALDAVLDISGPAGNRVSAQQAKTYTTAFDKDNGVITITSNNLINVSDLSGKRISLKLSNNAEMSFVVHSHDATSGVIRIVSRFGLQDGLNILSIEEA